MPLGNFIVLSKTRFILAQCIFQLQKQVLYEFPVSSRHKATATRFSTGIAHRMSMPCRTRYGLTKLQTSWNIFLEIRKRSRQIKRINTRLKRRSQDAQASFICTSRHYSNWFSCACALLKLLKWNIILLVKTPIIFKSLNEVCEQSTFRNVKRDNQLLTTACFIHLGFNSHRVLKAGHQTPYPLHNGQTAIARLRDPSFQIRDSEMLFNFENPRFPRFYCESPIFRDC